MPKHVLRSVVLLVWLAPFAAHAGWRTALRSWWQGGVGRHAVLADARAHEEREHFVAAYRVAREHALAAVKYLRGLNPSEPDYAERVIEAQDILDEFSVSFLTLLHHDRVAVFRSQELPLGEFPQLRVDGFTVLPSGASAINQLAQKMRQSARPYELFFDLRADFDPAAMGVDWEHRRLVLDPEVASSGLYLAHASTRFAIAATILSERAAARRQDAHWLLSNGSVILAELAGANFVGLQMWENLLANAPKEIAELAVPAKIAAKLARIEQLASAAERSASALREHLQRETESTPANAQRAPTLQAAEIATRYEFYFAQVARRVGELSAPSARASSTALLARQLYALGLDLPTPVPYDELLQRKDLAPLEIELAAKVNRCGGVF